MSEMIIAVLALIFISGIFFFSFLALLLKGFTSILEAKFEPRDKDIAHIKQDLSNHITELKAGQKELDNKLNQLLAKK